MIVHIRVYSIILVRDVIRFSAILPRYVWFISQKVAAEVSTIPSRQQVSVRSRVGTRTDVTKAG